MNQADVMSWTRHIVSLRSVASAGALAMLVVALASPTGEASAQDKPYGARKGPIVATIGLPPAVAVGEERLEAGEYALSRDILTGNTLVLRVRDDGSTEMLLRPLSGTNFPLKSVPPDQPECTSVLCLHNQAQSCYTDVSGDCVCMCGAFVQPQP
jgi:hypothetical protein